MRLQLRRCPIKVSQSARHGSLWFFPVYANRCVKGCEEKPTFPKLGKEREKRRYKNEEVKRRVNFFSLMWNLWDRVLLEKTGEEEEEEKEVMCSPQWSESPPSVSSSLLTLSYKRPLLLDSSLASSGINTPFFFSSISSSASFSLWWVMMGAIASPPACQKLPGQK